MSNPSKHLGLLLIDFQDVFLKAIPDRERLLKRSTFALKAADLLGVSVAVTEQLPKKLGATTEVLSSSWDVNTPVFDKNAFSAFEAEGLHRWIESNQIDHLLLTGIETSICIYQTALQALGADIGVTLLATASVNAALKTVPPCWNNYFPWTRISYLARRFFTAYLGAPNIHSFVNLMN